MTPRRTYALLDVFSCLAVALPLFNGCAGYQLGSRTLFRPDVRTVHVPIFESSSYRRQLGERLTEAVVKEIEKRTPYKVVHRPDADTVLSGVIVSERKRVIAEDVNDVPRDIETDLVVQATWFDRRGELLMQTQSIPLAPLTFSAAADVNFIPEAGQSVATAQQESIKRLARAIVSQMEMPW
jgi:hypothetical protein